MNLRTKFFGDLEILESKIIHFESGLLGFEHLKDYVILNNMDVEEPVPFMWLQSVKDEDVTFVVTFPYFLFPHYEIDLPDEAVAKLDIQNENEVGVYAIVRIDQDQRVEDMTVNLASPIVINARNFKALQFIRPDATYGIAEKIRS